MALGIYKPGQGKYARVTTGVLLALMAVYGVGALKGYLPNRPIFAVGGQSFTWALVVPAALFIVLAAAVLVLLNWPRFADFLIETETEMKKVDWPARRSVVVSSVVVVVTVVVMSLFLYAVDYAVYKFLKLIKLY